MKIHNWQTLKEKTEDLSLRERAILTAALLILVIFLWLQFYFQNVLDQHAKNENNVIQINQDIASYTEQLLSLEQRLANDPNAPLRKEQLRLNAELIELGDDIEDKLQHLIAPERMADLMQQVLVDFKGLTLLKAENIPAKPLEFGLKKKLSDAAQKELDEQAVIFEHGFEIKLHGSYFKALEFVKRLEAMEGFYWRYFDYQVDNYPNATIIIKLSTLSLEQEWIGV